MGAITDYFTDAVTSGADPQNRSVSRHRVEAALAFTWASSATLVLGALVSAVLIKATGRPATDAVVTPVDLDDDQVSDHHGSSLTIDAEEGPRTVREDAVQPRSAIALSQAVGWLELGVAVTVGRPVERPAAAFFEPWKKTTASTSTVCSYERPDDAAGDALIAQRVDAPGGADR